ncbi:restriction endonuclease subunit S [Cyclobacterium marinum]|uniref:restriction endonuclease subunit S n=1 Tax=Cyclobacterium marinum TaxID=104 RepID=UPI0011EE0D47|nr:restriction endonuclease subunit S [Cyclobacterium marinum]MBI0397980.1 restriction endonuclease subunit S [Cyclobacterium marinum]
MVEVNKVPELRFSEFIDDWNLSIFDQLVKVIDCKHRTPPYIEIGIPVVSPGTIKWGDLDLYAPTKWVSEEEYESLMDHCQPSIGDLVFSRNQSIGVASIVASDDKFVLGQDTVLITPKTADSYFVYQRLQTRNVQASIFALSGGSTFSRINLKDIRRLKFYVPNQESEQQKIASFLTAVEKRIQLLQKKKAKLEEYKKGVMQKLFPAKEGQTPEIRFKDDNGNDFPDWEEKKLGEVCKKAQSGGTPKSTNRDYYNGDIPFLAISDMTTQGKYLNYTSKSISQSGLANSSSWVVPPNSLIYSMYASVGFVSINKIPIATSQAVMNIILKEGYELEFLYYYLLYFQSKIHKYIETGTQGNINAQIVKNILVPIPSLLEQRKINSFLSSLDKSIGSIGKEIEDSKTFKKGLLQKMFV